MRINYLIKMNIFDLLGFDKPEHERQVLSEFLICLYNGKPIDYTLDSRKPKEPDVLVKRPEKEEYYELARILDYKWINIRLEALTNPGKQGKVSASKFGLTERDIVKSKLKKTYDTNSKDLHLLLYYDTGILYGGSPPVGLMIICNDIIRPLLDDDSIFKNIFIFDRRSQEILWKS